MSLKHREDDDDDDDDDEDNYSQEVHSEKLLHSTEHVFLHRGMSCDNFSKKVKSGSLDNPSFFTASLPTIPNAEG